MSKRSRSLVLACAGLGVAIVASFGASRWAPSAAAAAHGDAPPPRFSDGMVRFDRAPDEKGFWSLPSANSLIEEGKSAKMDAQGRLANLADASHVAPFQPWALALYEYRQKNNFADDPMHACVGPGSPRAMMTPGGIRIIQDRNLNRVYILYGGGNHGWRVVFLDGRKPPDPEEVVGTFYGNAVGHWEKDTLVVESIGFNTRFWFSNGGLPHTEGLHLTERFSRPSHDVLRYEVTVDDPRAYTRPWKSAWTLRWVPGDVPEYYCETGRP
ncbi:MAG TPA: hypothetical protein VGM84_11950 [Steroidobacteraceae bacterium]